MIKPQFRTLMIGNINPITKCSELFDLVSRFGKVIRIKTIPGKNFKFIEMSTSDEALNIEQKLNGYELNGSKLTVKKMYKYTR